MTAPVNWNQAHAADFAAIEAALHAVVNIDLTGATHADWLTTVRTVRDRVSTFALFIPNAQQVIMLLDTAEKLLLTVPAIRNLAKDA